MIQLTFPVGNRHDDGFKRGDYIDIALMDNRTEKQRILRVEPTCLTTRKVSRVKWFESVSAWIEDRILWPLSDFFK